MPPKKNVNFADDKGLELTQRRVVDHPEDYDRGYRHGYGDPPEDDDLLDETFYLNVARVVVVLVGVLFVARYFAGNRSSGSGSGGGTKMVPDEPNPENAFAKSGSYFRDMHQTLQEAADSGEEWTGGAADCHTGQCSSLTALMEQLADTSAGVHATVQSQGRQVEEGRQFLGNTMTGLELAMPVARTLYWSGPAGPALSYHYQLAVAHPAVCSSVDTAKDTHDGAQKNAERLTAVAQSYDSLTDGLSTLHGSS
ncbi:MAG: hypothetical protein K2Q25_11220 [Mycobacteriaceae bacterium]|nr:hypothetical protein [Mycobacteriaceae bacterium]